MSETRKCPDCGAEIPPDCCDGLCRACLLRLGLHEPLCVHVRCPHCHNPVELLEETPITDLECPSCGSHFSMVSAETGTYAVSGGETISHFELLDRVGIGSFGTVWKARDTELDRIVAVKIPRKEQLDAAETEQFLREARAAAQVRHPNIVSVHEVGREESCVYIVSDFVEGATLADWLTGQRLTPREAAELCVKIAEALHRAHEAGVVHRDLKPGNIILDLDGEPHLTDFGLAKRQAGEITMTVDGRVLGTPAYMSPEQAAGHGHTADRRSDIYSMGVILYELLTGSLPFRGAPRMLVVQVLRDEPMSPRRLNGAVSRDLETICLKCLEKNPDRRYQTADDFAEDLRLWLTGKPIVARPVSRLVRLWRLCRRHPGATAGAAAVAVSTLAAAVFLGVTVAVLARSRQLERSMREVSDHQLAIQLLDRGLKECAAGDGTRGLLWLGRSLEQAERCRDADLTQHVRTQLAQWSRTVPALDAILSDSSGDASSAIPARPGGAFAASWSAPGTVRVWNTETLAPFGKIINVGRGQGCLFLSSDGKLIVINGPTSAVQVWDTDSGKAISPLLEHEGQRISQAAISPNNETLAVGTASAGVSFWNVRTWHRVGPPQRHPHGWVKSIAFNPSGTKAVSCASTVVLWDVGAESVSRQILPRVVDARAAVFTPDGKVVAIAADTGVKFWDVERGQPVDSEVHEEYQIRNVRFAHEGQGNRTVSQFPNRTSCK